MRNIQPKDITLHKLKRIGKVVAVEAHSFETNVLVVGDRLKSELKHPYNDKQPEEESTTPSWMGHGGIFKINRVCDSFGVPMVSENIESCVADEEGLKVTLKDTSEEELRNCVRDTYRSGSDNTGQMMHSNIVQKEEEKLEIGMSQEEEHIIQQIEAVVSQANAASEEQKEELKELLLTFKDVFCKNKNDVGLTSAHEVRIPTYPDAGPIFTKQYKIPWASYDSVQEVISELESKKIIRPCNSTYNSPIWPVLKPNKTWRVCIDFRNLNKKVPISRWPMGDIDKSLVRLPLMLQMGFGPSLYIQQINIS